MSNSTQKYLRFLIPGMLGYFASYYICQACDFCSIDWPTSLDEVMKLTAVLLIAFFYDFTQLRKLSNRLPLFKVNAGIMDHLKAPFSEEDERISKISWNEFKDIYYRIIDNDETLKLRSESIRFNGTLWSSAADLRAISALAFIFTIIFGAADYLDLYDGFLLGELIKSAGIFFAAFAFSIPISWVLTNRHREMVRGQCDYILLHKRQELLEGLNGIVREK